MATPNIAPSVIRPSSSTCRTPVLQLPAPSPKTMRQQILSLGSLIPASAPKSRKENIAMTTQQATLQIPRTAREATDQGCILAGCKTYDEEFPGAHSASRKG